MVFHHFHHIRTSSHLRGIRSPAATAPSAESSESSSGRPGAGTRACDRRAAPWPWPGAAAAEVEAASFLHILYYVYIYMKNIYIYIYLGEKPMSPGKTGGLSSKNWPKVEVPYRKRWKAIGLHQQDLEGRPKLKAPKSRHFRENGYKIWAWHFGTFQPTAYSSYGSRHFVPHTDELWSSVASPLTRWSTNLWGGFEAEASPPWCPLCDKMNPPNQCFPGWCPSAKAEPQKTVLLVTLQGPVMQDRTEGWTQWLKAIENVTRQYPIPASQNPCLAGWFDPFPFLSIFSYIQTHTLIHHS